MRCALRGAPYFLRTRFCSVSRDTRRQALVSLESRTVLVRIRCEALLLPFTDLGTSSKISSSKSTKSFVKSSIFAKWNLPYF